MPSQLPTSLLLRHSLSTIFRAVLWVLRTALVAFAWLAVLPYTSLWIFRFYLYSADSVSHLVRSVFRPSTVVWSAARAGAAGSVLRGGEGKNVTTVMGVVVDQIVDKVCENKVGNLTAMYLPPTSPVKDPSLWSTMLHDTFTGQILTSIVVVLCVLGFLLREWVIMQAPFLDDPRPQELQVDVREVAGGLERGGTMEVVAGVDGGPARVRIREREEEQEQEQEVMLGVMEGGEGVQLGEWEEEEEWGSTDEEDADVDRQLFAHQYSDDDDEVEAGQRHPSRRGARNNSDSTDEDGNEGEGADSRRRVTRGEAERRRAARRERRERPVGGATPTAAGRLALPPARALPPPNPAGGPQPFGWNLPHQALAHDHAPAHPPANPAGIQPFGFPPNHLPPPPPPAPLLNVIRNGNGNAGENVLGLGVQQGMVPLLEAPQPAPWNDVAVAALQAAGFNGAQQLANGPPPPLPPLPALEAGGAGGAGGDAGGGNVEGGFDDGFGDEVFEGDVLEDFEGILDAVGLTGPLLGLVQKLGLMNLLIALALGATVWVPLCLGRALAAANAIMLFLRPLRWINTFSGPIFDTLLATVSHFPKLFLSSSATVNEAVSTAVITTPARPHLFALVAKHWDLMADSSEPLHRGLCVLLGYATMIASAVVYIRTTSAEYRESFDKTVKDMVRQQVLFFKVAMFVIVEIIIFPTVCGAILNLSTFSIFPDTTIASRLEFYAHAPVSALFLTWLAGTAFMFGFSEAVDCIRRSVRRGVMWFIRDPSAADLHPIREILERDSITQAKKITISAFLYASVILATFGVNVLFLRYACMGVLPLRWKWERPFSFPLDLILFRFVMPLALHLSNPPDRLRNLFLGWAKRTAHELRLSSFIFGGRDDSEEGTHVRHTWRSRLTLKKARIPVDEADFRGDGHHEDDGYLSCRRDVVFRRDGGFARVPAVDNIRVAPGRKIIVPVTEEGRPTTAEGLAIITLQMLEMASSRKADKYQIVYIPPHFKTRVALFVYLLWLTGSLATMGAFIVPLVIGRQFFSLVTPADIHDAYSLTIGLFCVSGVALALRHRPSPRSLPSVSSIATVLTSVMLVGVALPILASGFLSTYVLLPLPSLSAVMSSASRPTPNSTLPEINIPQAWATGLMILATGFHLINTPLFSLTNPVRQALASATELWHGGNRIGALDVANRAIAVPLFKYLSGLVILPGVVAAVIGPTLVSGLAFEQRYRHAYLIGRVGLLELTVKSRCAGVVSRWKNRLREDEFLLEMRLKNYGEDDSARVDQPVAVEPVE